MADDYTTLRDNIRARVPAVLDSMLDLELGNAVNEFLDQTNVWQEDIAISVVDGVSAYTVFSAQGEINRLMGVTENGRRLPCQLALPDQLSVQNVSAGQALVATVALVPPSTDPASIPDWIWLKFRLALIDGVLGRLMSQIAKPYSNERMAIYHMRRFRNLCAQARIEAQRDYNYAGRAWSFPRNFR